MIESMKEDIVRHHAHLLHCLLDEKVTIVSGKTVEEHICALTETLQEQHNLGVYDPSKYTLREIFTSSEDYRDFLRRELHERFGEDVYDPNHFIAVHKNQLRGDDAPVQQKPSLPIDNLVTGYASIGETPSDIASLIESAAKYGYSVSITAYPPSKEEDDDPTRP